MRPPPPLETRWKPGQTGNPAGRPRNKPISRAAEKLLSMKLPKDHALVRQVPELAGKTWAEAIVYGQALEAIKGTTVAAKELADRVEGKVKDEIEVSGSLDFTTAVAAAYDRARTKK